MPLIKQVILSLCVITILCGYSKIARAKDICSTPPSVAQMDQAFLQSLEEFPPKTKAKLLILPFEDGSQLLTPDTTLANAFLISLYDLLTRNSEIGVFHPSLALNLATQQANPHPFDEAASLNLAKEKKATHLILGLFQKTQKGLIRIFIKVVEVESGKVMGAPLEFELPETDRFFSIMSDAAKSLLQITTGKNSLKKSFKNYLAATPSFEAFRYYVKGMENSLSYDPINLEIAKAWFEKALALSYQFDEALSEKKRVLWMLSLYNRQMGKDVSLILAQAKADTLSHSISKTRLSPERWERAMQLAVQSQWLSPHQALSLLKQAANFTPEDGILLKELARRLKETGSENNEVLQKAIGLNPCLSNL